MNTQFLKRSGTSDQDDVLKQKEDIRQIINAVVRNYRSRVSPSRVTKAVVEINFALIFTLGLALSLLFYLLQRYASGDTLVSFSDGHRVSDLQFTVLAIGDICIFLFIPLQVAMCDFPRPWICYITPAKSEWFFDELSDEDLEALSKNEFIRYWLSSELSRVRLLTYSRLDNELERICQVPACFAAMDKRNARMSLVEPNPHIN